jgi:hypothetical protein
MDTNFLEFVAQRGYVRHMRDLTETIRIRVSAESKKDLDAHAAIYGLTLSAWARALLVYFSQVPIPTTEQIELLKKHDELMQKCNESFALLVALTRDREKNVGDVVEIYGKGETK